MVVVTHDVDPHSRIVITHVTLVKIRTAIVGMKVCSASRLLTHLTLTA